MSDDEPLETRLGETTDVIADAGRALAGKVRRALGRELQRQVVGPHLQQLVWFAALSSLVIEVFTVAPRKPGAASLTADDRRRMFEDFIRVTREDFEATLKAL